MQGTNFNNYNQRRKPSEIINSMDFGYIVGSDLIYLKPEYMLNLFNENETIIENAVQGGMERLRGYVINNYGGRFDGIDREYTMRGKKRNMVAVEVVSIFACYKLSLTSEATKESMQKSYDYAVSMCKEIQSWGFSLTSMTTDKRTQSLVYASNTQINKNRY